jgi:hypothetical protein
MSNLIFCERAHPGYLLGVRGEFCGLHVRKCPSLTCDEFVIVSPLSIGVVVAEKSRKSRHGVYNWYRMVLLDYSEGHLVTGWVCANFSGLAMTVLSKGD